MPLQIFGGSLLLPLRIDGYTFDRVGFTGSVDERFSTQLLDQLPDHIVSNYDTFVQFLKAYYEWSEQYGNPRGEGVRLTTYSDVDSTLDEFVQYFRDTYIKDFPFTLADGINEKNLIKHIGDLYNAKGSEASFDLLFQILYNTTIDITYPKDRVLRLSTSTFDDRQYIRTPAVMSIDEAKTLEETVIVQRYSLPNGNIVATALVDEVQYVNEGSIDFLSFAIQNVSGEFSTSLPLSLTTTGSTATTYRTTILPTLGSMTINSGGTGYQIGDLVVVNDEYGNKLLNARVNSIGAKGDVRGFNYTNNYGIYTTNSGITYTVDTVAGVGLSLSPKAEQALTDGPDNYYDESGKLSSRSFIQDSFYFQDYSYTIKVNRKLEEFADAVRRIVHPSGVLMFAEFVNEVSMTASAGFTADSLALFRPTIGHYLPHTFGTTIDPRGFTYSGTHYDFYPTGYNGQDGRTAGDFFDDGRMASITYGTPHMIPANGITHRPYYVAKTGSLVLFDTIETNRKLQNGAIGSTGYIGYGTDSNGEGLGLFGFSPVGSDVTNTIGVGFGSGVTHYGGYTCHPDSGLSGGLSGGQIIQVVGTDSATADYWIVYRHVNVLGIDGVGVTGSHDVYRIPVQPVSSTGEKILPSIGRRDGYGSDTFTSGPTLNGGATYIVGEIVRQQRSKEPEAIGRVIGFEASSYHQDFTSGGGSGEVTLGTPYYNIGIDHVLVEVLNGRFNKEIDSSSVYRPIVGDDSACSRLIDQSYTDVIHTSVTHDTSWMDVPINVMVNDIAYSNLTN